MSEPATYSVWCELCRVGATLSRERLGPWVEDHCGAANMLCDSRVSLPDFERLSFQSGAHPIECRRVRRGDPGVVVVGIDRPA